MDGARTRWRPRNRTRRKRRTRRRQYREDTIQVLQQLELLPQLWARCRRLAQQQDMSLQSAIPRPHRGGDKEEHDGRQRRQGTQDHPPEQPKPSTPSAMGRRTAAAPARTRARCGTRLRTSYAPISTHANDDSPSDELGEARVATSKCHAARPADYGTSHQHAATNNEPTATHAEFPSSGNGRRKLQQLQPGR